MEVDDIHSPASKYSRVNSNGERLDSAKIGLIGGNGSGGGGASLEDKTNVIRRAGPAITATSGGGGDMVGGGRFGRQWQHSSRIIRVSRASGGKDRHSKVWTAKGPRDRRVRLSVNTAIQFYDLQDRLGYDQPSKAVEWLIKAAADSINELPSLNTTNFPPETPRQLSDERRSGNLVLSSADAELDCNQNNMVQGQQQQQQQQVGTGSLSMSKSGCSSNNSETSKGSGLSLSRTEIRVKARERARERTAKDKDKDTEPSSRVSVAAHPHNHSNNHNHNHQQPMTQTSSFTQLLTAGINNLNENAAASSTPSPHHSGGGRGRDVADSTTTLQWLSSSCTTPMADYFGSGLMSLSASRPTNNSIHQQLGNGPLPHVMSLLPFSTSQEISHHQQQQQHFPFLHDHSFMPVPNNNTPTTGAGANGGSSSDNYNLNFSISSSSTTSGLAAGFNRGTLQSNSNSPSLLSYLQRFSSTADGGSSVPFFLGGAPISPVVQNQHHQEFNPAGLQLCYGDGTHHSDQKGKGKN